MKSLEHVRKQVDLKSVHIELLLALNNSQDHSTDLVFNMIYVYLEQAPHVLLDVATAISERDSSAFYEHLHRLRFGSERIGARHLSDLCKSVSPNSANILTESKMKSLFVEILNEFTQVEAELVKVANLLTGETVNL